MAMDYFNAMNAFMHAAETRSFTLAGRRLGISSSAVGKAIIRLEEDLGVRLFHRSTRAITLTAEGRLFLNRCQRIISELEVARSELIEANINPQGKLRVGLPQLGKYLLPQLVAFQKKFPEIELELNFSDRQVNVIDEGFDAVIRIGHIEDSLLTIRHLKGYRHSLVASTDYLDKHGTPMHPNDLTAHACLRYRYPGSGKLAAWPLHNNGHPISVELPQSAIADVVQALYAMVEADLGIALLPEFVVADAIAAGRLANVLEEHIHDEQPVAILWPSGRQSLPKTKAFIDFISNELGSA